MRVWELAVVDEVLNAGTDRCPGKYVKGCVFHDFPSSCKASSKVKPHLEVFSRWKRGKCEQCGRPVGSKLSAQHLPQIEVVNRT